MGFKIEKADKLFVKWKSYDRYITDSYIIDRNIMNMSQYFPKPYSSCKDIKVESDLPSYTAKSNVLKKQMSIHYLLQKKFI